jgi:MFS family permease
MVAATGRPRWLMLPALMLGGASMGLFFAIAPVLAAIAQHFGGDHADVVAQVMLLIPSVGFMAGGWLSGGLLARLGLRRLALGSAALYGVMGGLGLVVNDPWSLLVSRLLVGFTASCLVTACVALTAELYSADARARLIGYEVAAGGFAAVIGVFVAGLVGTEFGWRAPFSIFLVFGALAVLLLGLTFPSDLAVKPVPGARPQGSLRAVWPIYAIAVPTSTILVLGPSQVPFVLAGDGISDPAIQSVVISMGAISTILMSIAYGSVQARIGRPNCLTLGLVAATAALAFLGFGHSPAAIGSGSALIGVAAGFFSPYVREMAIIRAPLDLRARVIGQLSAATSAGSILAPFLVAPLRSAFGLHGAMLVLAAAAGAATACGASLRDGKALAAGGLNADT